MPEDGEMPEDLLPPEDALPPPPPPPAYFGPPPPIVTQISIDGFIVVGLKNALVIFTPPLPEEMVDGMIPEEIGEPIEPADPVEIAEPVAEE